MFPRLDRIHERFRRSYARLVLISTMPVGKAREEVLRRESWLFLKRAGVMFWHAVILWLRLKFGRR